MEWIKLTIVLVADQNHSLRSYGENLGVETKLVPATSTCRWLTVVSPEEPDGAQWVLEPNADPSAEACRRALYGAGIPLTAFEVDDAQAEVGRLRSRGIGIAVEPAEMGGTMQAAYDDTGGNLIRLCQSP